MAFGVRPVRVPIVGVDKFSKTFGAIGKKLTGAGQKLSQTGQTMTRNVTLPIVAAGAAILATAGGFEASMNTVGVLTGATGEQFEMLSSRARDLGATTQFAASEAADAMTYLAMAGLNTQEVYDALPGTLQLAAAAGTDLATAADIATNIMTPFNMKADELTRINDVLANTFTRTNTNMLQLAEGMKFVAPVAASMGIKIEEASAAMGLLGNAGIQGAMAGTTLRGVLSKLANPTKEAVKVLQKLKIKKSDVLDSEGNVKSLVDVVSAFEKSGAGAADMLKVFGQRAGPGMSALVNQGTKALIDQTEANKKSGTAAEVAEARMKGLFGQLKKLKSAAQELAISIGEAGLLQGTTKLLEKITGMVTWLGQLDPATKNFIMVIAGIAAAIGPVLVGLGIFIKLIGLASTALAFIAPIGASIIAFTVTWGGLIVAILGPIALFIGSIWAIVNTIKLLVTNWDELMDAFSSKFHFLQTLNFFLADIARSFANLARFIPFVGAQTADFLDDAARGLEMEAAERAAAQYAPAAGNTTTTNNAEVLLKVQSEGVPVRAERKGGKNVSIQTDTGIAFAGG